MQPYFIVYFDKSSNTYKLQDCNPRNNVCGFEFKHTDIAMFSTFDMAYQYVTRLNGTNESSAYTKWSVNK